MGPVPPALANGPLPPARSRRPRCYRSSPCPTPRTSSTPASATTWSVTPSRGTPAGRARRRDQPAVPGPRPPGEPRRGGPAPDAGPAVRRPARHRAGDVHGVFVHLYRPGAPARGRLLCCDPSAEWTAVARRYWDRAALTDRIELHLGPALQILAGLRDEPRFDFAFVDADKAEYIAYYEALVPRMAPGGLIAVDNVLRRGKVAGLSAPDERTMLIRAFNDHVLADARTEFGDRSHRGWIEPDHRDRGIAAVSPRPGEAWRRRPRRSSSPPRRSGSPPPRRPGSWCS